MVNISDAACSKRYPRAQPGAFIIGDDLAAMYKWFQLVNPTSLLYKVWFDLSYYFMMSESDVQSMLQMRRDSFLVKIDQRKRRYVILKDQQMFNGLADLAGNNGVELRMYEMPGSARCPVTSLVVYLQHIHPGVAHVWQRPREIYRLSEPGVWYDMCPLGLTRLSRMMQQLCRLAGLSMIYRTHHVHNTAMRHLELAGVPPALLRELRGRGSSQAERVCRPDSECCDATVICRRESEAARKRRLAAMLM